MNTPPWLAEMQRHDGLREIPGAPTAPQIARWLQDLGAWWRDDEAPWCGVAMAGVFKTCGLKYPKAWYRAKEWATVGVPLDAPARGAIVVFERQGGGHVGLVAGKDARGRLMVLGGNQGDAVRLSPFDIVARPPLAYRWPLEALSSFMAGLPLLESGGVASSTNEA